MRNLLAVFATGFLVMAAAFGALPALASPAGGMANLAVVEATSGSSLVEEAGYRHRRRGGVHFYFGGYSPRVYGYSYRPYRSYYRPYYYRSYGHGWGGRHYSRRHW